MFWREACYGGKDMYIPAIISNTVNYIFPPKTDARVK